MTSRRLAAILAADVVGFSSMMERDEEGTLRLLKTTHETSSSPAFASTTDVSSRPPETVEPACRSLTTWSARF